MPNAAIAQLYTRVTYSNNGIGGQRKIFVDGTKIGVLGNPDETVNFAFAKKELQPPDKVVLLKANACGYVETNLNHKRLPPIGGVEPYYWGVEWNNGDSGLGWEEGEEVQMVNGCPTAAGIDRSSGITTGYKYYAGPFTPGSRVPLKFKSYAPIRYTKANACGIAVFDTKIPHAQWINFSVNWGHANNPNPTAPTDYQSGSNMSNPSLNNVAINKGMPICRKVGGQNIPFVPYVP